MRIEKGSGEMKLKKFLYFIFIVWLIFPCIIVFIWITGSELLIGTHGTPFRIQSVLNIMAASSGILLAFLHYGKSEKNITDKIFSFLPAASLTMLLLCGNLLCMLLDNGEEYHSFSSPDGAHTIVIKENVSVISGLVTLYERKNPFLIYPKERMITDDGYRPVCMGEYSLEWHDHSVTLTAFDGAGKWKTVTAVLGEDKN